MEVQQAYAVKMKKKMIIFPSCECNAMRVMRHKGIIRRCGCSKGKKKKKKGPSSSTYASTPILLYTVME